MHNIKGYVVRELDGKAIRFRFTNLTHYLYLKLLRTDGVIEDTLTHFEVRMYLFMAALEAAETPVSTKESLFEDVMDKLSEDEQISIFEEGGQYLDFVGKLALDLKATKAHLEKQKEIIQSGMEMLTEISTLSVMENQLTESLNQIETPETA